MKSYLFILVVIVLTASLWAHAEAEQVDFLVTTDSANPDNTDNHFVARLVQKVAIEDARAELNKTSGFRIIAGTVDKSPAAWNPGWSFHLTPETVFFADFFIEMCDANVTFVEENLAEAGADFLPNLQWCPWGTRVLQELSNDRSAPTAPPGPTDSPTRSPRSGPTAIPTTEPSAGLTVPPTQLPSTRPTSTPTKAPTKIPTAIMPVNTLTTMPTSMADAPLLDSNKTIVPQPENATNTTELPWMENVTVPMDENATLVPLPETNATDSIELLENATNDSELAWVENVTDSESTETNATFPNVTGSAELPWLGNSTEVPEWTNTTTNSTDSLSDSTLLPDGNMTVLPSMENMTDTDANITTLAEYATQVPAADTNETGLPSLENSTTIAAENNQTGWPAMENATDSLGTNQTTLAPLPVGENITEPLPTDITVAVDFLVTSDMANPNNTDQHFVARIVQEASIADARAELNKTSGFKIISGIIEKTPVVWNPGWSFHLQPETVLFGDFFVESCDATVGFVEENLESADGVFLPNLQWCPWGTRVLEELQTVSYTAAPTPSP